MKAEDLRIGNLVDIAKSVKGKTKKKYFKVAVIESNPLRIAILKRHPVWLYFFEDEILPIPLTPDWLHKLGAVKELGSVLYSYGRFVLHWKEKYNYWYVTDKQGNYMTKVEFVHEWQNFVYVMDGNELTIKEESK